MIKAVIFDLDGTLIDSDPCWKEADFLFAKEYSFPLTEEFTKQLSGLGIRESAQLFIEEYKLKETVEEFMRLREKYLYKILLSKLKLMPFAEELLVRLKNKKYILALATAGHGTEVTIQILKKLSIYQYFDFVISGLEVKHSKPAPDVYLYVTKKMALKPSECVAVEDTANGVLSGKAAGMKVIGVNVNDVVKSKLLVAKSDFVFSNLNIADEFWTNSLEKN
jgi:HAD superfamily hydrolase (TIGR01509 family)